MHISNSFTINVPFTDNRMGTCWTDIRNGRCEADIMGLMRREECCSTFGRAWGSPCEACPQSFGDCQRGFMEHNGVCRGECCNDKLKNQNFVFFSFFHFFFLFFFFFFTKCI